MTSALVTTMVATTGAISAQPDSALDIAGDGKSITTVTSAPPVEAPMDDSSTTPKAGPVTPPSEHSTAATNLSPGDKNHLRSLLL